MPELIIGDHNWQEHVGQLQSDGTRLVDFEGPRICNAVRPSVLMATLRGVHLIGEDAIIPRDQWDARIAEKDANGSWLYDLMELHNVQAKDQNGLGYCHSYGTASAIEVTRLAQGHPYVELSAESLGGPITGWQNRGAMPDESLKQARDYGPCPQSMMNDRWSLQEYRWDRNWTQARLNYRVLEFTDFDLRGRTFDAVVTAALSNIPTCAGFGWWLHAFLYGIKVRKRDGQYEIMGLNSWGNNYGDRGRFWLRGSRAVPDLDVIGPRVIMPFDR